MDRSNSQDALEGAGGTVERLDKVAQTGETTKELEQVGDLEQEGINGLDKGNNQVINQATDKESDKVLHHKKKTVDDGVGGNLGNDVDNATDKRNLAKVSEELIDTGVQRGEGSGENSDLGGSVSRGLDEGVDSAVDKSKNSLDVCVNVLNSVEELSGSELSGGICGSRSSHGHGGKGSGGDELGRDHCSSCLSVREKRRGGWCCQEAVAV